MTQAELENAYPILRFFVWEHLKREDMRQLSAAHARLAWEIARSSSEYNDETKKALDRLLEAKDAAVRGIL